MDETPPYPPLTSAERLRRLDATLARGIADAAAGRIRPAEEVFDELAARYARKAEECGE